MGKILLVTIQDINIGNRLQNYALQTVIQNLGNEVYTPYYRNGGSNTVINKTKIIIKCFLGKSGVDKYSSVGLKAKRQKAFHKFNKKYITNLIQMDLVCKENQSLQNYDYAVTGSDQVWHKWTEYKEELEYFYLEFMPYEKRISYAPSFGFSEFPEEDLETHRKGLKGMFRLSCREVRGQEIIYELVGKKAEHVLDPTLLLTAQEWKSIETMPHYKIKEGYILTYFLGNIWDYEPVIQKFANENRLNIININDVFEKKYYLPTPDEFIWLIEHADFVCTDSFHALVFSILFHKKFYVYRRKGDNCDNMFDRMESLLDMTQLANREYTGEIRNIKDEINWNVVDERIEIEKRKSMKYLNNALGGRE